jgi:hypothetical protein
MLSHQRYLVIFPLLVLLISSYYFFGIFVPCVRITEAKNNRASGYHYCNDLYPIWVASHELFQGRNPYAPQLTPTIETGLYGRPLVRGSVLDSEVNMRAFAYPLYTIFLFAPMATLPFSAVQIVMLILLPVLAALTVVIWLRILGPHFCWTAYFATICLSLASYPVLEGVYAGQPGLLVALFITGAFAALVHEHYVAAGVLLPLASIKPQLISLIALWMLGWALSRWSERKRFAISLLITTLVLLTASLCLQPNWVSGWMQMLREYRLLSSPPLSQSVLGRLAGGLVVLFLLTICAWVGWNNRFQTANSEGFLLTTVFLLTTTVLVFPSAIAVYDQFLLLPAILWLFSHRDRLLRDRRSTRLLALIVVGAVTWQWVGICVLGLTSALGHGVACSPGLLLLPLRTAASVPFAVAGLLCVGAVRHQRAENFNSQSRV